MRQEDMQQRIKGCLSANGVPPAQFGRGRAGEFLSHRGKSDPKRRAEREVRRHLNKRDAIHRILRFG